MKARLWPGETSIRRTRRIPRSDPPFAGPDISGLAPDEETIGDESLAELSTHDMGRLAGRTVALSASEVDDPATQALALTSQRRLVVELTRHLLEEGARIAYGGDFRQGGLTELLVKVQRSHASGTGAATPRIVSYLREPLPEEERARYVDAVRFVDVRFIDSAGRADDSGAARARSQAMSLRAMRSEIVHDAMALVAVGGRTSGFTGWRPGVSEEIAAAVAADNPVFLVGGFGGSASWYAKAAFLGCDMPRAVAPPELGAETTGRLALPSADEVVRALRAQTPGNGLTQTENALLARTVDIDEIVALVLSGLAKIQDSEAGA